MVDALVGTSERAAVRTTQTGQRVMPGICHIVVQAWGPTRVRCMEAAAKGLLDHVDVPPGPVLEVEHRLPAGDARAILADVLRIVCEVRMSRGPVSGVELRAAPGGDLRLRLRVHEAAEPRCRGPRRVSPQWVSVVRTDSGWRCEATIDR